MAVDAVFDSVSVATTFRENWSRLGILFCSFSEAVLKYPELGAEISGFGGAAHRQLFRGLEFGGLQRWIFCLIPERRAMSDGTLHVFPHQCPGTGQFERTLIVAEEGSYVSYLEGCTAPMRDRNQLHAAVVELVALDDAQIRYATVQNWYPGDTEGRAASTTS